MGSSGRGGIAHSRVNGGSSEGDGGADGEMTKESRRLPGPVQDTEDEKVKL